MYAFDLDAVRRAMEAMDSNWKEFMRVESLSMGVYRLKAGERDPQKPHTEDEVYFVTRGRAKFEAGDNVQRVAHDPLCGGVSRTSLYRHRGGPRSPRDLHPRRGFDATAGVALRDG